MKIFRDSVRSEGYKQPPPDWKKLLTVISKVHSLQELGDYYRLIWELSAACPVSYVSSTAVPSGLITADQKRMESYNFTVRVDGMTLYKPVHLSKNPGGYTSTRIDSQKLRIYDRLLAFHGYIVVQEGASLKPDELRGILIRIKNVAIGYYDPSMLDYRFNEGPRSRWVTGEIYVDDGLEDALNIDRDSFNRFHPQFRAVQEYVHRLLRGEIFPAVYKQIERRSKQKAVVKAATRTQHLSAMLTGVYGKPVEIKHGRDASSSVPTAVVEKARSVTITLPPPESIDTKKANRQLAESILTIFDLSQQETSPAKRRERFVTLLLEFLERW